MAEGDKVVVGGTTAQELLDMVQESLANIVAAGAAK